jgi:hypothetical protein
VIESLLFRSGHDHISALNELRSSGKEYSFLDVFIRGLAECLAHDSLRGSDTVAMMRCRIREMEMQ